MKMKVMTMCVMAVVCVSLVSAASANYVNRIYWTQFTGSEGVYRANPDGSGTEQIVGVTFNSLDGLAIDPVENKLYVGTSYDLLRCNLDGSALETVISGGNAFDFYDLEIDVSNRKIYWSDWIQDGPTPGIRRANLDGTSLETIFEGSISHGKAIDPEGGELYWTAGSIYKSDLDGSNRVTVLENTFGQGHLDGLALDVPSNKMYFTTWEQGGIWRANMDGTDVESLLDDKTTAIAVDTYGGKLYWTSWAYGQDEIRRANLDGSGEEVVCLMGGAGNDIALEIILEPDTLLALIDIDPDTLNKKSYGKWITVYITLPDGFDVGTIDTSSIAITSLIGETCDPEYTQEADLSFTPQVGDRDEDGILDLTVKFDRQVLLANLCLDDVSITIEGELTTGELFSGSDSIRIIDLYMIYSELADAFLVMDILDGGLLFSDSHDIDNQAVPDSASIDEDDNLDTPKEDVPEPDEDSQVTGDKVAVEEAASVTLYGAAETISALDQEHFSNPESATALAIEMVAVLAMMDGGLYGEARDLLENDILERTDGCADVGEPDENDWITSFEGQGVVLRDYLLSRNSNNLSSSIKRYPVERYPVSSYTTKIPQRGLVNGIVSSEDGFCALIGIEVVREGDTIDGITIVKIHPDKVEFEKDGKRWTQGLNETPGPEWQ